MNQPLISVIVPIYKVEQFLPNCVNSILNQTHKNLEIILVDDGSPDNCPKICDEYAEKDSRIKVIHQQNAGLSAARNAGLDIATGEYISLIDSDDFIHPTFLEYLLKILLKNDCDISECSFEKVDENDVLNNNFNFSLNNDEELVIVDNIGALSRIHDDSLEICLKSVVVWNKLYKSNLFKDIRYPVGKQHEDEFTTYQLFNKCKKLISSNKPLHAYVKRNSSIMNSGFKLKRLDALEAYDQYMNFFIEKGIPDLQERSARRYLRLLGILLKEVTNSDFNEKNSIILLLKNKFDEICSFLEQLLKSNTDLQNRTTFHKQYCDIFNDIYNNIKMN